MLPLITIPTAWAKVLKNQFHSKQTNCINKIFHKYLINKTNKWISPRKWVFLNAESSNITYKIMKCTKATTGNIRILTDHSSRIADPNKSVLFLFAFLPENA